MIGQYKLGTFFTLDREISTDNQIVYTKPKYPKKWNMGKFDIGINYV